MSIVSGWHPQMRKQGSVVDGRVVQRLRGSGTRQPVLGSPLLAGVVGLVGMGQWVFVGFGTREDVGVTEKVYLVDHGAIQSQLGLRVPRAAFSGATLDLVFTGDIDKLDASTRAAVVGFVTDFLDCGCESNPYCGHPEEKFIRYLLALRAAGMEPEEIVAVMRDEYRLTAYPGDVLSFLDGAVRTLEAAEALAGVLGEHEEAARIRKTRESLV